MTDYLDDTMIDLHLLIMISSHTRNSADRSALELGDFELRVEHVFDEGRVLVDFVRCAGQLELFDDLERVIDLEDHAGGADAEGAGLGAADAARGLVYVSVKSTMRQCRRLRYCIFCMFLKRKEKKQILPALSTPNFDCFLCKVNDSYNL